MPCHTRATPIGNPRGHTRSPPHLAARGGVGGHGDGSCCAWICEIARECCSFFNFTQHRTLFGRILRTRAASSRGILLIICHLSAHYICLVPIPTLSIPESALEEFNFTSENALCMLHISSHAPLCHAPTFPVP